jgi:RNA polymerase sigma factor (sigma-70 family)
MTNDDLLEHWSAAVRVTQGLVDSREDAEDCASAAVLQLLERGSEGIASTQAFLVAVAKRRAVDKARSHMRARRRDVRLAAQPPAALDVAEDVAARAEARWVAELARERLSTRAYRLLRLLADGHDMGDAADALGMTQRAAESLLLRARRTVRGSWSKTLAALGGCLVALRRLKVSAPAVALVASALVVSTGSPDSSAVLPAPAPVVTSTADGHAVPSLRLSALAMPRASTPTTARAPRRVPARAKPTQPAPLVDVRTPTGDRVWASQEERPGRSSSRVDTVKRCVEDFQVTTQHIGC